MTLFFPGRLITKKLHHRMTGTLREFQYKKILARVDHEFPKDDRRRLVFLANDPGNCSFPAIINSALRFSRDEFQTALGRKLAIQLPCLAEHIGAPIASNGKSRKLAVDPFGENCPWGFWRPLPDYARRVH
jgi:hypothetical protein